MIVSALVISTPAVAAADWAPHCDDGQLSTSQYWASTGQYTTPRSVGWTDGTTYNKVELRYNAAARCVWGLYTGGKSAQVYLDRSTNGGASWAGWLGARGPSTSVYTGVYNDYSPYVARACANYGGRSFCTGWY